MGLPPRLLSGTFVSSAGRLVGTALSVVTIGVITRSLALTEGVGAYGRYATILTILSFLAILADGGLYLVFTRRAAQSAAIDEAVLLRRVVRLRLWMFLGVVLIGIGILPMFPYPVDIRHGVLIGSFGIGSQLVSQLLLGVFQKRLRMVTPALGEVVGRAVTLGGALLVTAWGGGVLWFVAAFVVGAVATLFWNLLGVLRLLPPASFRQSPSSSPDTMSIIWESWPVGLMLLCWFIVFRVDSLLLSLLRPAEDLAWYGLPYRILESLLFFPAMVGGLLFPRLSKDVTNTAVFHETLRAATRVFVLCALPTVVALILAAPWIIAVLGGPAFLPSVPVLRILAVALGALFFGNLYGNSAIALGAQRALLGIAAVLALANMLVNLWVIPRYSFTGAAWTTLGTELVSAAGAGWLVMRATRRLLWAAEDWRLVSAGSVLFIGAVLPLAPLVRVLVSMSAYVGVLFLLGILRPRQVIHLLRAQRLTSADQEMSA